MANIFEEIKSKYQNFCIQNEITSPKVSVIIPVFNTEKYLEKCLESVIKQTLKDIEIIIVDDGSKDKSPQIVQAFASIDKRIKVITQANKGVSVARNRGLEIVKGEYTGFIDSDDWVDENYLEKLYTASVKNNCDIAAATIIRKRERSQKYRVHYTEEKVYDSFSEKINICNIPKCCYACGKLYKTNLVKKLNFKENVYFEDVIWTPQIIDMSDKLITVPNTVYWYRVNNNSIVKTTNKKKQFDSYKANKLLLEYLSKKGIELSEKTKNLTKETNYFCGILILKTKEKNNNLTVLLFGIIPIYKRHILKEFKYKDTKKFLFFKNLDAHYYIELFNFLKISFKNGKKFEYKEINEYGLEKSTRREKLIVSLTSFPDRIKTVHIAINTLLNQTIKPDKLILWLAYSQFPNKEKDLPQELLKLRDYGLEIKWCEDLKSYKKLVPALREFPNDIIVTADDDLYYQRDWLESLYHAYLKEPNFIYTRRACKIALKNNLFSIVSDYVNENYAPTYLNQQFGGAGTLYPPHSLHKDIFNIDLIKTLIPTHDDIYFWMMSILNGTKICLVKNKDTSIYNIEGSQKSSLCKQHSKKGKGMRPREAFKRVLEHYPEAYDLLERESV